MHHHHGTTTTTVTHHHASAFDASQMSITDAFLAFKSGLPVDDQPAFPEFLGKLSYQLIHNSFDADAFQSPGPAGAASRRSSPAVVAVVPSHEQHALLNLCILSPFNRQINPRRQCSVKNCTRKTELYCADCSKIDHTNGHRLFYCCGPGQRVTCDRRERINGERNPAFETLKITQPYCYKYHLDHLNEEPDKSAESDCSDSSML